MDPLTIALFAVGAKLAGSILGAGAAGDAAEANARTLDQNAALADQAAGDAIARGQLLSGRTLMRGSAVAAAQKTAYAAAGVDTQSGSPADVQSSTSGLSALDAAVASNNAAREAWGYKTKAVQYRRQAELTRSAARGNAIGAILGTAVGVARIALPFLSVSGQDDVEVDPAAAAAAGGYDAASIYGTGV